MKAHASAAARRPGTVNELLRLNASHNAEDHDRKSGFPNHGTHPWMVMDITHVRTFHRPINTHAVRSRAVKMDFLFTSVDTLTYKTYL